MTIALAGAAVGLAFAIAEYVLFGALIRRAATRSETGRGTYALDLVRKAQLIAFPVIGFFLGQIVAGRTGVQ
jgi:hypothetical protein